MLQRQRDRERKARLEAEAVAEQALRELYQEQQALLRETAERKRLEREHLEALKAEQLRVVRVTMRTVQDIVNNCLNQLQLLRFDAEAHVSTESLMLFDQAICETTEKLRELGDLEVFAERQMTIGTFLDPSACRDPAEGS